MSEDKVKRKSFFTPCRSVGLKRRSTGTPSPAQNSPKTLFLAGESAGSNCTPKRVEAKFRQKPLCRLPKTLKTFAAEDENKETSVVQTSATKDENEGTSVVEDLNCTVDTKQIESCPLDLEKQITEVELRLNQLKNDIQSLESISLNAKQHDRDKLNELIVKWRNGCQEALDDLLIEYKNRDNSFTMLTLLSSLGIPPSLVHYSETDTDFYE